MKHKTFTSYENLEQELSKKLKQKDKRKKPKMKISGKSVFGLKQVIVQKSKKIRK